MVRPRPVHILIAAAAATVVGGCAVVLPSQAANLRTSTNASPNAGTGGQSGTAPGQSETAPGQSGTAPGQSGTAPGQSGTAPGQPGTTPGQSGTAPGQPGTTPGQSDSAPGRSGAAPGQSADPAGASPPTAGHAVEATAATGRVTVVLPGGESQDLKAGMSLPAGTLVDATQGSVQLPSPGGKKPGVFTGGRFVVRETTGAHAVTELRLAGGSFAGCPTTSVAAARAHAARVTARPRSRHAVVRQLWGKDNHGSFTTRGRNAAATVRGTEWLTQDRCDGTRVAVRAGAVLVHDTTRHRDVIVRAGHSYLVPTRP